MDLVYQQENPDLPPPMRLPRERRAQAQLRRAWLELGTATTTLLNKVSTKPRSGRGGALHNGLSTRLRARVFTILSVALRRGFELKLLKQGLWYHAVVPFRSRYQRKDLRAKSQRSASVPERLDQ